MEMINLMANLNQVLKEMGRIDDSKSYYAITYIANEKGDIESSIQTYWVGWGDEQCKTELRAPSLVNPHRTAKLWEFIERPYLVVKKPNHYILYSFLGGHALIAQEIAQEFEPDILQPMSCARSGRLGFVGVPDLPKQAFNHAPNPKQRMRIIKRDNYRCRICGRKPSDYSDVELHIHHIRPWGRGGLTEDENLITVCHTCHKGLDPYEDHSLFDLINTNELSVETTKLEYMRGVAWYREVVWNAFQEPDIKQERKRLTSRRR